MAADNGNTSRNNETLDDNRYVMPRQPEVMDSNPPFESVVAWLGVNRPVVLRDGIDPWVAIKSTFVGRDDPDDSAFWEPRGVSQWHEERSLKWARNGEDGEYILPSEATVDMLLNGGSKWGYRNSSHTALVSLSFEPIAYELGASDEDISRTKERVSEYAAQREEYNQAEQDRFARELTESLGFACLPMTVQNEVRRSLQGRSLPKCIDELWDSATELLKRQDSGEIITNFGGWSRDGGNNAAENWVINPDGTFRERDFVTGGNGGVYEYWDVVGEGEVALSWYRASKDSSSDFIVSYGDPESIAPEQLATVRGIEERLRAIPNAFGLDVIETERHNALREEIIALVETLPPEFQEFMERDGGIDLANIMSDNGVYAHEGYEPHPMTPRRARYSETVCSRDAAVIWQREVEGGVLELLSYEKWGKWNVNIRMRETADDDSEFDDESDKSDGVTDDMLRALQNRFR